MRRTHLAAMAGLAFAAAAAGPAAGQVLHFADFENGQPGPWLVNGIGTMFGSGGNPGQYIGLPYGDFWGVTLQCQEAGQPMTGDLTRHGGPLTFELDVNVIQLHNWMPKPIPPDNFPFIIEFVDYPAPGSPDPIVSVYYTGPGLPPQGTWGHFSFDVPDPNSTTLPPGWGGTGAEDPVTFAPILPPDRTYTSVLQNVDEMRFTTFQPGWFYIANFWEVGFDNIRVSVDACYPDCNGDSALTIADFGCFQGKFVAQDPYADCNADSALTIADFGCFQGKFVTGCP